MEGRRKELVNKGIPWSRDARWELVAIEGILVLGVGLFMVFDTRRAGDVVLQLIGVALLAASAVLAWSSFRNPDQSPQFYGAFRSGIGVACGAIATASWWSDYIEASAVRLILGWGLIAWSLIHAAGLIATREPGTFRISTIVITLLSLVLGLVLLTGDATTNESRLTLIGIIMLLFGAALMGLVYFLYSNARESSARSTQGVS